MVIVRRILGVLLLVAGAGVAGVPLMTPAPDDTVFLSVLDSAEREGGVTGTIWDRGDSYTYTIEKEVLEKDQDGNHLSWSITLRAVQRPSGGERVYRRTTSRLPGGGEKIVLETPTRTTVKEITPGATPPPEAVTRDETPLLARPATHTAFYVAGGVCGALGLLLVWWPRRRPPAAEGGQGAARPRRRAR